MNGQNTQKGIASDGRGPPFDKLRARAEYHKKFILLDRDGTLVRDPGQPIMTVTSEDILSGVVEGLRLLQDNGYEFFIVSNQSGIARGNYTEEKFLESQRQTFSVFKEQGITFDGAEYCPHHPDANCGCRKPAIGMWNRLKERYSGLIPENGAMIGNRNSDVGFGKAVGCRTARIDTGQYPYTVIADDTVRSVGEFAERLIHGNPTVQLLHDVAALSEKAREEGKTIVTTNGTFDLLHPGHLYLLTQARLRGDLLIVGVNSDASVKRYKGPDRPVEPQDVRALKVARHSDAVFIFDDDDPRPWLSKIRPHVHVNAETYGKDCVEAPVLREIGAELVLVPVQPEFGSTSAILQNRRA